MPVEVERKFRITSLDASRLPDGEAITQGYLSFEPEVRVRLRADRAFLTVKGPGTHERREFEYRIPFDDGRELLGLCSATITKTRYIVGNIEIDVYHGALEGLAVAEVEGRADSVTRPEWIEWVEVTGDSRYLNRNLARAGRLPDHPDQ